MNNYADLIFLGDSLTFGYGVHKKDSWVYKIQHSLTSTSLNKACNGDTTPSMLSRYYKDVISYNPNKTFIMGGTNDLIMGRKVSTIIKNLELMVIDSLEINSKVIIGIPPTIIVTMANNLFSHSPFYNYAEIELHTLKEAIINLCINYSLEFIDFHTLTLNNENIYLDGLHLNSYGNDLMYNLALPYF